EEGDGRAGETRREPGPQGRRRPHRAGLRAVARLAGSAVHAPGAARGPGEGAARSRRESGNDKGAGLARRGSAHRSAARPRIGNLAAVSISRRSFLGAGAQLAAVAAGGAVFARSAHAAGINSTQLAPGTWLLDGAGCNVLALQGPQGSLLVDGGDAK